MRRSLRTIRPNRRDAINIIRPRHMYTESENWQTKKQLIDKRAHYN
jgi:hypothetical protein